MQKMLKRFMNAALLLFFLQISCAAFAFVVDHWDLFDGFEYMVEALIIAFSVFIIVDLVFIWVLLSKVSNARRKNDISAVEIVGEDIQEVYNFGQMGIILIDSNNCIIWTNDWFEGIQARIVDKDIYAWQPDLVALKEDSSKDINIGLENRMYNVKYLKEANLFIFKDITQYNSVIKYNREHSPVVGIMQIDDYQDVIGVLDESKVSDLNIAIQKVILDYGKKFGFLVRRLRPDTFSFIATQTQYDKMMEDNFKVLNEIKEIDVFNAALEITMSIGIGLGTDDYIRLNEMASSCINVCLSRGGDQAVIHPYGSKLIFIGGRTESRAGSSNVKMRVLSKSLETQVQTFDKIFVMGHIAMDMDALGSCLGVVSFAKAFNKDVKIVYDERFVEAKTRKAFKSQYHEKVKEMTISPKDCIEELENYGEHALLILCDHHSAKMSLSKDVTNSAYKIAVLDHHRRGEDFIDNPTFAYIDPAASSASEIVAELVKYNEAQIDLNETIATFMLAGILLDTNYYRNKTSDKTYDASVVLKDRGADNLLADSFLKEEYNEYLLKIKIMSTAETPHYGVVVCTSEEDVIVDRTILSIAAEDVLGVEGVNACFVVGRIGEQQIGISGRSDGTVNVQYIMEKMGGGGHFAAAAAQISEKDGSVKKTHDKLIETMNLYLADARTDKK